MDGLAHLAFLVVPGVVARFSRKRDALALGVREVAVTALAAAVDETGSFQVGNQLAELARHCGIEVILEEESRPPG